MKKNILTFSIILICLWVKAQTIADFESFTLSPNSAFSPSITTVFQTSNAQFEYEWDSSFGGFWSGGFAYTNKTDSANGSFSNLYGVKAYTGYSNSANFVVGQDGGVIKLKSPNNTVNGFYITNTTYAYKVIRNGDSFSRKFGDTTGAGSGTTIAQGSYPDFFKITARGYLNGILKPDSAEFYLADFRFSNNAQDYIVNAWQWFNTTALGVVDSITFNIFSSDNSAFGMNTPAFFALDNFTTSGPNITALKQLENTDRTNVYPNPFTQTLQIEKETDEETEVKLYGPDGKILFEGYTGKNKTTVNTSGFAPGVYSIILRNSKGTTFKKLIKNPS